MKGLSSMSRNPYDSENLNDQFEFDDFKEQSEPGPLKPTLYDHFRAAGTIAMAVGIVAAIIWGCIYHETVTAFLVIGIICSLLLATLYMMILDPEGIPEDYC